MSSPAVNADPPSRNPASTPMRAMPLWLAGRYAALFVRGAWWLAGRSRWKRPLVAFLAALIGVAAGVFAGLTGAAWPAWVGAAAVMLAICFAMIWLAVVLMLVVYSLLRVLPGCGVWVSRCPAAMFTCRPAVFDRRADVYVGNAVTWPIGRKNARPLLTAACQMADEQGKRVRLRADNQDLARDLYSQPPFNFVTVKDGKRPVMIRTPTR